MSKDIFSTVLDELKEEFVVNSKGMSLYSKNILNSLVDNKAEEYKIHKIKPTDEEIKKEMNTFFEVIADTIIKSREYKDKIYKKSYDKLKALVDEGKDFKYIITEIYSDEPFLNDIFIRLVEDKEGVAITSAKQLQELTGCTEIYGDWEERGDNKPTKKEAQENALKEMEDIFIQGMYNRYFTTIEDMLEAGVKYKDLLLLNPKDFNLPEQWGGTLAENKEEVILWTIGFTYLVGEPAGLMMLPSLRAVAEDIEAPYSVLMKCYKIHNK